MKAHLIAVTLFTGVLAFSMAHGKSTSEAQPADPRAGEYLAAVKVVQERYASYGLDVQREALIRLSAYHYPEYAADQIVSQLGNC